MERVPKQKLNDFATLVEEFLRKSYVRKEVLQSRSAGKPSLIIDFDVLDKFSPELADFVLDSPQQAFRLFRKGVASVDLIEKELNVRFTNLRPSSIIRIRNIRSEHLGKLIVIEGGIRTCSDIRPRVKEIIYSCPSCAAEIILKQDEERQEAPTQCNSCGRKETFKVERSRSLVRGTQGGAFHSIVGNRCRSRRNPRFA